jgi:transcriptional regulator with XRE-family HTH domain
MNRDIVDTILSRRLQLGLSQRRLADLTGLSASMISALENRSRNVSLANVERILDVLDLTLSVREKSYDWDVLCALGCPLQQKSDLKVERTSGNLSLELSKAAVYLSSRSSESNLSRHRYAVVALFAALRNLYPELFKGIPVTFSPKLDDKNKIRKLTRLAEARISEYL